MAGHITVAESARRMKQPMNYVYGLLWAGLLAGYKRKGKWFVSADSVDQRIKKRCKRTGNSQQFAEVEPSTSVEQVIES